MIRCIAANKEDEFLGQFFIVLTKVITGVYPNSEVVLVQNTPYWKQADNSEVIYNITNDTPILVCDFIKIFNLTWIYTDGMVLDVEINQSVYEEEAIWSQLNHSSEIFIVQDIKWVDVYTWIDR